MIFIIEIIMTMMMIIILIIRRLVRGMLTGCVSSGGIELENSDAGRTSSI